jgi:hypothetical protein
VKSWLSVEEIGNSGPSPSTERIEDYLIRHTRGVPRNIVVLGNRLSRYVLGARTQGLPSTDEGIRLEVSRAAREFASTQLAQCANQVMSDTMPGDAVDHDYVHVFLEPNE